MKTALLVWLCAALAAASNEVSAASSGEATRHLRSPRVLWTDDLHPSISTGGMSNHAAIGTQCAYDQSKDPSLYPCADGGVCVRTSPLYGACVTQEDAVRRQASAADRSTNVDDESDDTGEDNGENEAVGEKTEDNQDDDEDDDDEENDDDQENDDDEEDDEDEDAAPMPSPLPATV